MGIGSAYECSYSGYCFRLGVQLQWVFVPPRSAVVVGGIPSANDLGLSCPIEVESASRDPLHAGTSTEHQGSGKTTTLPSPQNGGGGM